MMLQSILAAMFVIATAAPAQDTGKSNVGQMREVKPSTQSTTNPPSADNQPAAKPAATQPPIAANQSASGDSDKNKKTSDDAGEDRIRRIRSLRDGEPMPRRRAPGSDVLDRLRERSDKTPVIPPVQQRITRVKRTTVAEGAIPSNALRPVDRKLMPDGSRIVDRTGRLTRDGDYLTYTFESRGEGPVEVPLRLLPNRLLEDMEMISEGGRKSVVFVVSGEITEYRGVNYLLLQKLLIRPDLGNLR